MCSIGGLFGINIREQLQGKRQTLEKHIEWLVIYVPTHEVLELLAGISFSIWLLVLSPYLLAVATSKKWPT
jgi:hypothetical protein